MKCYVSSSGEIRDVKALTQLYTANTILPRSFQGPVEDWLCGSACGSVGAVGCLVCGTWVPEEFVAADSWEPGLRPCDPGPGALTSGQEGWLQLVRKLESFLGRMASERWERMEIICPLRMSFIPRLFICIFLVVDKVSADLHSLIALSQQTA